MREPIEFWVAGEPKGQPRPRAFVRGGHAAVYDPGTAEGWKSQIALAIKELPPFAKWTGPISLKLNFYFPRPRSHYRTGKHSETLRDDAPVYHTAKPDSDNVAKAVCDALTALQVWTDDSLVCHLVVHKRYSQKPGCAVSIAEAD